MKKIFIKLDKKSSLYKALKERNLIDYRNYISIYMTDVPRIGESFVLPYDSLMNKDNDVLKKYFSNRRNNKPIMKVEDIIIHEAMKGSVLYYLKCTYVSDSLNWLYNKDIEQ